MIKDFVIFDDFIDYEGPFEVRKLYELIENFIYNHHYDTHEKRNYERRNEDGRYLEIELEPNKTVSNYIKLHLNIRIIVRDIIDIDIEEKGEKKTIQQGDLSIRFRSFILKDRGSSWERNPSLFFLRHMVDKFVYKMHIGMYQDEVKNDTHLLQDNIRKFLNLYQRR